MADTTPPDGRERARRRGRLVVSVTLYGVLVAFIAMAAADISWQLYAPHTRDAAVTCKEGLASLVAAVDTARDAAAAEDEANEEAALARFRAAVDPSWRKRDDIALACKEDPKLSAALDAIERLRYAEEHAVRREAVELSPLRRRVHELSERVLGSPQGGPPRDSPPSHR